MALVTPVRGGTLQGAVGWEKGGGEGRKGEGRKGEGEGREGREKGGKGGEQEGRKGMDRGERGRGEKVEGGGRKGEERKGGAGAGASGAVRILTSLLPLNSYIEAVRPLYSVVGNPIGKKTHIFTFDGKIEYIILPMLILFLDMWQNTYGWMLRL